MSRTPQDARIDTRTARLKLAARKEPYWRQIHPGTFLGYYAGGPGRAGTWIARQRTGTGYRHQRIAIADDHADADGDVVLTYLQAIERARTTQVEARAQHPRHYADGVTLNSLFDLYLDDRQRSPGGRRQRVMAAGTTTISRAFWKRHVADSIGTRLVSAMDDRALKAWHAGLVKVAPTVRGKAQPYDPTDPAQIRARRATANRVLTIVKATLAWGREARQLPADMPDWWRTVRPFHLGDDPPPRMLDADEIRRLLNAAAPDLRDLLAGALATGARYGELASLRARDYQREHGVVALHQHKTAKTLHQPLTPEGRALFDRLTAGRSGVEHIFRRADGSAWGRSDARRPMIEAVGAARLEGVTFKTTRATYGKLLLLATRDIELVARALGHSDSRITRKHYAQLLPGEVAAGVAMMPELGLEPEAKTTVKSIRRAASRQ